MADYDKLTDEELVSRISEEVGAADYSGTNELSFQRQQSTRAFHGELSDGLAPMTGMSSIVNNKVQPAIETLTTYLSKIFTSDQDTVVFTPTSEKFPSVAAHQITDVVNHVIHKKNEGYNIINRWVKDAAINKNGIVKVTWKEEPTSYRMEFTGSEDAISVAIDEEALRSNTESFILGKETTEEILEVSGAGIPEDIEVSEKITTVSVRFTKDVGMPFIENIPPEEFLINEGATSINGDPKTNFVCHRRILSISDIIADPRFDIENADEIEGGSVSGFLTYQDETQNRHSFDDTYSLNGNTVSEENGRFVEVIESWIKADRDGDGIQEWRHCFTVGNMLLFDEEWFGDIPFASFTFFPSPHKFYGQGVYDKISAYHRAASMLLRSEIDMRLLQNTYRIIADPKKFNMRDLMSNRPGIIRASDFEKGSIEVLPAPSGAGNTTAILEYLHKEIVGQIGIDPNSGQISQDVEKSGNDAAKTSQVIDNASAKIEQFAREFAENGLRPVIWLIVQLLVEHSDEESIQKLVTKVTPDHPKLLIAEEDVLEWLDKDDISAKVGLGHQTMQQKLQGVSMIMQDHEKMELNQANPVSIPYKYKKKVREVLINAVGFDSVADFYPTEQEVQAAAQAKAQQMQQQLQMQMQMQQTQQQDDLQNSDAKRRLEEAQAKKAEVEANAAERSQQLAEEAKVVEIENIKQDNELNVRRQEAQEEQMVANLENQQRDDMRDMDKAELVSATAIEVAEISAKSKNKGAE